MYIVHYELMTTIERGGASALRRRSKRIQRGMMTVIKLHGLSFQYTATEELFQSLNLEVSSGTICGLLGKNGTGKTTLLRLIAGLLIPQQGNCAVLERIPSQRLPQFLQEIYLLPEEFYVPDVTMHAYVDLFSPFYPRFNRSELQHLLTEFELPPEKKLTALSYGQKKKFLVAFALATNCKLLLLDEPTNGLDIPSKSQFRRLLAANLSEQKTIMISTHQVRDLENLLDSVVILDTGKIIFNHTLRDVASKLAFMRQATLPTSFNFNVDSDPTGAQLSQQLLQSQASIMYAEKILGGYMVVQKRSLNNVPNNYDNSVLAAEGDTGNIGDATEEDIDLEVLFNAVLANKDHINAAF